EDLGGSGVPYLAPEPNRIPAFRADRVGPRADQIPHDFRRDLGVELHRRDRLGEAERLRRAGLVRGEELGPGRDLIDDVEMGLLHRDLAFLRPGEERILPPFRRELDTHRADLAALRAADDLRA